MIEMRQLKGNKKTRGHIKAPLFRPPLIMNLDKRDISGLVKTESHIWFRIGDSDDEIGASDIGF